MIEGAIAIATEHTTATTEYFGKICPTKLDCKLEGMIVIATERSAGTTGENFGKLCLTKLNLMFEGAIAQDEWIAF